MPSTISPYSTALALSRPKPGWVTNQADQQRVTVYHTYEDIFNNVKEAFAVTLRDADGEDISRRYVPAARTIIESTNRYLAKDPELVFEVPPDVTVAEEQQKSIMAALDSFWRREQVGIKFNTLKRWMMVRGDGLLHISADPAKEEGKRLRLNGLDPSSYFTIPDALDPERVRGCYLVSIVLDDEGEELAQRIEYQRVMSPEDSQAFNGAPVGSIFYRIGFFEPDGWDDRYPAKPEDLKPATSVPSWAQPGEGALDYIAGYALPTDITALPVYHFRNNRRENEPYGLSELQGIETLLSGLTQTLTDEDLAMSLQGIGVYATDSGRPRDDQGNEVDWVIAPASVIEMEKDAKFTRVQGVDSIQPMMDHFEQLQVSARETTGTPDVAVGRVDVTVAESGIALQIQFAPIVAKNAEKEDELKSKMDQFLYDLLNGWFPAYEGINATGLVVSMVFGDPLPVNREAVVKEVTELIKTGQQVIPKRFALQILKEKLGYDIDPVALLAELQQESATELDAAGARLADAEQDLA